MSPAAPGTVRGDELSDAKAKQAQLKKDIAAQKAMVEQLNALQIDLAAGIRQTTDQLKGINADLAAVKVKITGMQAKINVIKKDYAALLAQLADLDAQLVQITAKEAAKRTELAERKAKLADRLRSAYDTDRTSLLESFLSGGTFTDLLAEMSYYIDVGEQDKALANQIAVDQETLAAIHQTTIDTRTRTDDLRLQTAAQKRALDRSLAQLNAAKVALRKLEKRVAVRARAAEARLPDPAAQQGRRQACRGKGERGPEAAAVADQLAHPQAAPGRQHPVPVQRHPVLADER